ncbi:MAG: GWxTD domain-containing protein [Melioribacteraceae bacterium]|nr:GWxTD domain-containing protein [Melioribacteraceae bacterium]
MMIIITRLINSVRIIFIFLFILVSVPYAQTRGDSDQKTGSNLFEKNIFPIADSLDCYISFRIPFNRLIFIKSNETFSSGVQLDFELKENNRLLQRKTFSKKVSANSYEESNSGDKYLEGFVKFRIDNKNHVISPTLQIDNTNQLIQLDSILINAYRMFQNQFVYPVVVEKLSNNCADEGQYRLVNQKNNIPFSSSDYSLLIPVISDSIKEISLKLEQDGIVIFEQKLEINNSSLRIIDCDGSPILASVDNGKQTSYFIVDNFNKELKEGPVQVIISNQSEVAKFNMNVEWINKPFTLSNPNLAVELLEIIYDRKDILELYKKKNEEKYKSLVDFWNNKLPDRKYAFNELMNEFYKRADYAAQNFSTLANPNGAKTDRGRIYIRYGMPDDTKRDYTSSKSVVEIWYYKDLKKEFIFTDKTGLGNYTLGD